MREIKFRGLDSNGVWHYGNLLQSKPFKDGRIDCWIQPKTLLTLGANSTPTSSFVKVIEKTVGQLIGPRNKFGACIWEGDVVKESDGSLWEVSFVDGQFYVPTLSDHIYWDEYETAGNTHQNPELLEK
jgi:hypothetical protein